MTLRNNVRLPPEQQAIRDRCFHPAGDFVEFPKEDVEQSIPARFEKIVSTYADRVAIKFETQSLKYGELNSQANRLARSVIDRLGNKPEPVAIFLRNMPA